MNQIAGIGFSTAQASNLDGLDEHLMQIVGLGASHAELALFGMDIIAGGRIVGQRLNRLVQICRNHDLKYTVHGPLSANLMSPNDLDRYEAAVAASLQVAGAVGASALVHHPGIVAMATADTLDRQHQQEREALKRLGDVAAQNGVRIAVETLPLFDVTKYTPRPSRLAAEIKAIDHEHVVGTLDFSHVYLHCNFLGLNLERELTAFAEVAGHLHVHDSFGRVSLQKSYSRTEDLAFGLGDLHLPLGWGDFPWRQMLPKLSFLPGTVWNFELPPPYFDEAADCMSEAEKLIPIIGRERSDRDRIAA